MCFPITSPDARSSFPEPGRAVKGCPGAASGSCPLAGRCRHGAGRARGEASGASISPGLFGRTASGPIPRDVPAL